jgi:hypothetical protein
MKRSRDSKKHPSDQILVIRKRTEAAQKCQRRSRYEEEVSLLEYDAGYPIASNSLLKNRLGGTPGQLVLGDKQLTVRIEHVSHRNDTRGVGLFRAVAHAL